MIDWHSHVLPDMDDGSRDVGESLSLLRLLSEQKADKVVATPHFYANDESVSEFIGRRQRSYESLRASLPKESPDILLGAEVLYYPGIIRLPELHELCIQNSKLLLLEMPMERWSDYTVKELIDIANTRNVRPVLAHIERYLSTQKRKVFDNLLDAGILMQVNASFFAEPSTKRKALSYLKKGCIHLIGSDCHNISHRPPRLDKAYENIRARLGDESLVQLDEFGTSLFI